MTDLAGAKGDTPATQVAAQDVARRKDATQQPIAACGGFIKRWLTYTKMQPGMETSSNELEL